MTLGMGIEGFRFGARRFGSADHVFCKSKHTIVFSCSPQLLPQLTQAQLAKVQSRRKELTPRHLERRAAPSPNLSNGASPNSRTLGGAGGGGATGSYSLAPPGVDRPRPIELVFVSRHERPVTDLVYDEGHGFLYSCSKDKSIVRWDLSVEKRIEPLCTLCGHEGAVWSIDTWKQGRRDILGVWGL